jgi:hypothetical protein
VGRGQPIKLLQDELKLGMHVPRASISRRQLTVADKQLAADLSSGNAEKFAGAVATMLDRGMIRQTAPDEAVEKVAQEIVEARAKGKDMVAVSSVHRISDALAERIHDLHAERTGREGQTALDVHVQRNLQPAELRSSQFYKIGDVVEYKAENAIVRAPVVSVESDALTVDHHGQMHQLHFRQVRAVFDRSRIERGPGEKLLLQEKIKQGDRMFEKGSRQTIGKIVGDVIHFASGLRLRANDGRVRQGDCLTDYKAQGIKGAQVRGIEDNGSALAMANKEAFHVKGTRHVQNLVLHVENKELYVEAIQRSNEKFSALQLERVAVAPALELPPALNKGQLLMQVRSWGKEFISRVAAHMPMEKIRQHLTRFEALRPRLSEIVAEKVAVKESVSAQKIMPSSKEAVTEKVTPAPSQTPREKPQEGLSSTVEEMAKKLRQKRDESIKERPAPPAERPKQSPYYAPTVHRPRQGGGYRM